MIGHEIAPVRWQSRYQVSLGPQKQYSTTQVGSWQDTYPIHRPTGTDFSKRTTRAKPSSIRRTGDRLESSMFKALERQEHVGNRLLRSLSAEEHARLRPSTRVVTLPLGEVLYECGERIDYVYFPTTCVVSLLYTMRDGSTAEMALAGNDGVVGIALFLGGGNIPHRAVAQIGGLAFEIPPQGFQKGVLPRGPLQPPFLPLITDPI